MNAHESSNIIELRQATGDQKGRIFTLALRTDEAVVLGPDARFLGRWTREQAATQFIIPGLSADRLHFAIQWANAELEFRLPRREKQVLIDWMYSAIAEGGDAAISALRRRCWMQFAVGLALLTVIGAIAVGSSMMILKGWNHHLLFDGGGLITAAVLFGMGLEGLIRLRRLQRRSRQVQLAASANP